LNLPQLSCPGNRKRGIGGRKKKGKKKKKEKRKVRHSKIMWKGEGKGENRVLYFPTTV